MHIDWRDTQYRNTKKVLQAFPSRIVNWQDNAENFNRLLYPSRYRTAILGRLTWFYNQHTKSHKKLPLFVAKEPSKW